MQNFLNSMLGSWFKTFMVAFFTLIIANGSFAGLDWLHVLDAAAISTLPSIANWFNKKDPRYGLKEDSDKVS